MRESKELIRTSNSPICGHFLRFPSGWLFPNNRFFMKNGRTVAQRTARLGWSVSIAYVLRGLLLLLLAGPTSSWAQAPSFTQAISLNPTAATGNSIGRAVALDAAGNQCIIGTFTGTLVLGTTTLVTAGFYDVFVAKRNASTGAWLWAVRVGGNGTDYGYGIAADAAGNVLVTGSFLNTASFATSPTATILTSGGDSDIFVAKFEASTGAALWAVRAGGYSYDYGTGVTADAAGNALVTGYFTGFARFDASSAAITIVSSATATDVDAFVAKFGASTGAASWAVRAGGSGNDRGQAVAVDAAGNALVTGYFNGTATFDTSPTATTLTSAGGNDIFVAKFGAATGAATWAVRAGGSGDDQGLGIATDAAGNASITGYFTNTASFATTPTATSLVSAGSRDVFAARFGAGTGAATWAVRAGGSGNEFGYGAAVDAAGNLVVTGSFEGTASFATSPTATSLTATASNDMFVARFGAGTGTAAWAVRAGSNNPSEGYGVAVDAGGNAVVTGQFFSTALIGSQTLKGNGTTAFIAGTGGGVLSTAAATKAAPPTVFPNPAQGYFTLALPPVSEAATATATLVNALGQVVSTRTLRLLATGATAEYATSSLAPGLYTLRVRAGETTAAVRVAVH